MDPRRPAEADRLADAYLSAHYRLRAPAGELVFSLQRWTAAADPAGPAGLPGPLAELGKSWALITPCNPMSVPLSVEENSARLARFRAAVAGLGEHPAFPTISSAPDGSWAEAGLCLMEIELPVALALARAYQQHAFLFKSDSAVVSGAGPSAGAVWLVWCASGVRTRVQPVMLESACGRSRPA